ncbi:hypothetical protein FISHEDRAFT_69402 [Fistulina hepatica ATCC 64428]|uniref:Uncharacterized protein n=1 Tax=Fistulina hepatica ATCC 64428 TaxID=1128425 RepID=A0A0D7AM54_9AGAR|nr:hypothetical protein FISHEDRAFT_69402 [Fistulina hepatica ATCC 64428]
MSLAYPSAPNTPEAIPTIRLVSATPAAAGLSEASTSFSSPASWASVPTPLAPKTNVVTRRRLVPKKSKLGLLGRTSNEKDKGKDLSDVIRRVGGSGSTRGGFEIYVDRTEDPDIGEILVVQKKKSRAALDGMTWGALGETTNVPRTSAPTRPAKTSTSALKAENEENKWWSFSRQRKDTGKKEPLKASKKAALPARSKTPEPLRLPKESRARFNSLDSGILLKAPTALPPSDGSNPPTPAFALDSDAQLHRAADQRVDIHTPASAPTLSVPSPGLLAPPNLVLPDSMNEGPSSNQGSIAMRAMRSMRSLAHIASWVQPKNGAESDHAKKGKKDKKEDRKKKKDEGRKKEKEVKKEKVLKQKKEKAQTVRLGSTSSFEAGRLTSPEKLVNKKRSVLGLGFPSTMRVPVPTARNGSTASSIGGNGPRDIPNATTTVDNNRLSVESAELMARNRIPSTMSAGSSVRPASTASCSSYNSRISSGSSTSIRWDERGLETVQEMRNKEREAKKNEDVGGKGNARKRTSEAVAADDQEATKKKRDDRESNHSVEGRRRTPISEVFRDAQSVRSWSSSVADSVNPLPMLTIEEATSDGHGSCGDSAASVNMTTPPKPRRRPVSEQLLNRSRPLGFHEDQQGVISMLDAATKDLAQLITTLDLQATPGSTYGTPADSAKRRQDARNMPKWKPSVEAITMKHEEKLPESPSPLAKTLRHNTVSIASLRPYAQSRKNFSPPKNEPQTSVVGQQIAPWRVLNKLVASPPRSPRQEPPSSPVRRLRPKKRASIPSPAPDPCPVLQPLHPARSRNTVRPIRTSDASIVNNGSRGGRALTDFTFGGADSDSIEMGRKTVDSIRNSPSLNRRFSHETRRILGLSGTMGGSEVSAYADPDLDVSDPDSDIPDELQVILSHSPGDDTLSFPASAVPSSLPPTSPPAEPLPTPEVSVVQNNEDDDSAPVFCANVTVDGGDCVELDIEEDHLSEEDQDKSFDFTNELKKLSESGGSDRLSFVEQLENAFRTPADSKVDLVYGLGQGFLDAKLPPVPPLPMVEIAKSQSCHSAMQESSLVIEDPSGNVKRNSESSNCSKISPTASILPIRPEPSLSNVREPDFEPASDSPCSVTEVSKDEVLAASTQALRSASSASTSGSSEGRLNTSFRFGGRPSQRQVKQKPVPAITLSDIVPPLSHAREFSQSSLMLGDDSVLRSILAQAEEVCDRRDSDSRNDRCAGDVLAVPAPGSFNESRPTSVINMSRPASGVSFKGFESFDEVRRGFEFNDYRPAFYPPADTSRHGRHESVLSIASVSSYGRVIDGGTPDPFDFGLPSLRGRPTSDGMSISMSLTVDDTFSFLNHQPRKRVESDASSFYFRAPIGNTSRGHRRQQSSISAAPPVSLYNRSFGSHLRNDSVGSMSSVAQSYIMHSGNAGRLSMVRHRPEMSSDSIMSDFSAMRLGRPGIGDKMFDTATDHGMPLEAISASPTDEAFDSIMDADSRRLNKHSSYDSGLDDIKSTTDDSLFDKTGDRSSASSGSVFGYENSQQVSRHLLPPDHFRPLSMMSYTSYTSVHEPIREDDTMISMFGGGHVRRQSLASIIEMSPCLRIEKRKRPDTDAADDEHEESPSKARIVTKPSIASTSSYHFGGERMIRANHGLLHRESLEENCLVGNGEDDSGTFGYFPVFSRPEPAARSRSSTCTSESEGATTPPLSSSDGSSMSGGSQSSIDIAHIMSSLTNATHPMVSRPSRARPRGQGHRRPMSRASHQARMSRSFMYETITEEASPTQTVPVSSVSSDSPTTSQPIFVVNEDTVSIHSRSSSSESISFWNDEQGIVALRKFYALRSEAEELVTESKRVWADTPFSLFAVQNFNPPNSPAGMCALLEHSVKHYGPLSAELRHRRQLSRPSPYPQSEVSKASAIEHEAQRTIKRSPPLRDLPSNVNINTAATVEVKEVSKSVLDEDHADGKPVIRPRVGSAARRSALGWSRRNVGKSSTEHRKENMIGEATPVQGLRFNRPRPRSRQTPLGQSRSARNN